MIRRTLEVYACCSARKSPPTHCSLTDCCTLDSSVLHYLLEFVQTHVHWVDDAIQPSHPLPPLLFLPLIFTSISWHFSSETPLHIRWPKYWSFSFSNSPFNKEGLISLRINWFDLLAIQGTCKSLLPHQFESIGWVPKINICKITIVNLMLFNHRNYFSHNVWHVLKK